MKKNVKTIIHVGFTIALLVASAPASAEVINRIAAIVNDEVITETELDRAIERSKKEAGAKPNSDERSEMLGRLVDNVLMDQLVAEAKITVSDDDLARAIAGILHDNQMSLEQLKGELASKGTTYEHYKDDMSREIKRVKFLNQVIGPQVKITDQDLRDYYQRNQDQFRGSHEAHIAEIVLPLSGVSTQGEFEALRDEALSIVAKARQGKNFAELAAKHTKGPAAESGGDLGMIDLKKLPTLVSATIRKMQVGQISQPILADNAIVIVNLISLPEISAGDFERTRDDIYAALYDERIEETLYSYLSKERQKAFIDIR